MKFEYPALIIALTVSNEFENLNTFITQDNELKIQVSSFNLCIFFPYYVRFDFYKMFIQ